MLITGLLLGGGAVEVVGCGGCWVVSVDRLHGGEVGLYFIRYKRFLECDRNAPCESLSGQAAASRASSCLSAVVCELLPVNVHTWD